MMFGGTFKMTKKTRLYLWLYRFFDRIGKIGQYFISHCDMEPNNIEDEEKKAFIRMLEKEKKGSEY